MYGPLRLWLNGCDAGTGRTIGSAGRGKGVAVPAVLTDARGRIVKGPAYCGFDAPTASSLYYLIQSPRIPIQPSDE